MKFKLLLLFILFICCINCLKNCKKYPSAGIIVYWEIINTNIQFSILADNVGLNGWIAIGLNSLGKTMDGGTVVLAYGSVVNEYKSNGFVIPSLITPKFTLTSSTAIGSKLEVNYTRPLLNGGDSSYIEVKNERLSFFFAKFLPFFFKLN